MCFVIGPIDNRVIRLQHSHTQSRIRLQYLHLFLHGNLLCAYLVALDVFLFPCGNLYTDVETDQCTDLGAAMEPGN